MIRQTLWDAVGKGSPVPDVADPMSFRAAMAHGMKVNPRLRKVTPKQFEALVCDVLNSLGIMSLELSRDMSDNGIDGKGYIISTRNRVALQAKRLRNTAGVADVREFIGSLSDYDCGIFVTTSFFSSGAENLERMPLSKLILINGVELTAIMKAKAIGVKQESGKPEEVLETYFQKFG